MQPARCQHALHVREAIFPVSRLSAQHAFSGIAHLTKVQAVSRAPPRMPPRTTCSTSLRLISGSSSGSSSSFAPPAMACKGRDMHCQGTGRVHTCEANRSGHLGSTTCCIAWLHNLLPAILILLELHHPDVQEDCSIDGQAAGMARPRLLSDCKSTK